MKIHLEREIDKVNTKVLELSAEVERALELATNALLKLDINAAKAVINYDHQIDQHEVDLEEECLKILSLYQPFATDLRQIVSILKINNDLERIGDLARNIAEYVIEIKKYGDVKIPKEFRSMLKEVRIMLQLSLDALITQDSNIALKVAEHDDKVDKLNVKIIMKVKQEIIETPEKIDSLLFLISAANNIERVGDYAENIAEYIYYMVEGKIIRHHFQETE